MDIYLVGGAVRDELLGRPVTDRDWVVVGATAQELIAEGFKPVGRDFPVFLHPKTGEEYALARTERKIGRGYHGFEFHADPSVTLEEDLQRRDLTINAIARSADSRLIDPYGGVGDLNAKVLRHVSAAFREDPVRILRVARFLARLAEDGFCIAPETQDLMAAMVADGEAGALVAERVWQELVSALSEPRPSAFLQVTRTCGALAVLIPELDRLYGVPQPEAHHPEVDTGIHIEQCVDMAAKLGAPASVVFAVMMHDLGKGLTPRTDWPHHYGHESAGVPIVRRVCERLGTPRDFRRLAEKVTRYHLHVHRAFDLKASTLLKVLEGTDAFRNPEHFNEFLLACECDARGRTGLEEKPYPQRAYFKLLHAAAAGVDSAPLREANLQGPAFGEALKRLRIKAIETVRDQASQANDPGGS